MKTLFAAIAGLALIAAPLSFADAKPKGKYHQASPKKMGNDSAKAGANATGGGGGFAKSGSNSSAKATGGTGYSSQHGMIFGGNNSVVIKLGY